MHARYAVPCYAPRALSSHLSLPPPAPPGLLLVALTFYASMALGSAAQEWRSSRLPALLVLALLVLPYAAFCWWITVCRWYLEEMVGLEPGVGPGAVGAGLLRPQSWSTLTLLLNSGTPVPFRSQQLTLDSCSACQPMPIAGAALPIASSLSCPERPSLLPPPYPQSHDLFMLGPHWQAFFGALPGAVRPKDPDAPDSDQEDETGANARKAGPTPGQMRVSSALQGAPGTEGGNPPDLGLSLGPHWALAPAGALPSLPPATPEEGGVRAGGRRPRVLGSHDAGAAGPGGGARGGSLGGGANAMASGGYQPGAEGAEGGQGARYGKWNGGMADVANAIMSGAAGPGADTRNSTSGAAAAEQGSSSYLSGGVRGMGANTMLSGANSQGQLRRQPTDGGSSPLDSSAPEGSSPAAAAAAAMGYNLMTSGGQRLRTHSPDPEDELRRGAEVGNVPEGAEQQGGKKKKRGASVEADPMALNPMAVPRASVLMRPDLTAPLPAPPGGEALHCWNLRNACTSTTISFVVSCHRAARCEALHRQC